jgi:hypothetical protein
MAARLITPFIFVLALAGTTSAQSHGAAPNEIFWSELTKLCGSAYSGVIVADTSPNPDFTGKSMTMHVRACEKDRIRIPFVVGTNRSRTWILSRKGDRIELKHDHRHEDGTPDKVTMYGGTTTSSGEAARQFFPADAETTRVVAAPAKGAPSAAANVWWIELVPGDYFTYNLRRLGSDRLFSVKFDLKRPVAAPEAPWGWKQ